MLHGRVLNNLIPDSFILTNTISILHIEVMSCVYTVCPVLYKQSSSLDVDVDVDANEKIVLSIKSSERGDVPTISSSFSACYIRKLCKHKLFQS
jgi:hypothetical protein